MKQIGFGIVAAVVTLGCAAQSNDLSKPLSATGSSGPSRHSFFVGGVALTTPFEKASDFRGLPPGSSSDLQNSAAVAFAYNYNLNDEVELQLQLSTPFKADLNSKGSFFASVPTLGTLKILPPQAYVIYNVRGRGARFRPYLGAGFGYAFVVDEKPSAQTLALAGPDARFTVSNELFPAVTLGADYQLSKAIAARLQVNYNVISVDTVLTSSGLPVPLSQRVKVNPILVAFGLRVAF